MKAVIVEIKDNVAAVLSEDGRISKIKNKNYAIGQEVTLKNTGKYIKLTASAAAALAIFATPAWAYLTPYSYVSLDVNPSFEFSVNRFDRVLEVKAANDVGEKVIGEMSVAGLKNKEINEAVKNVLVELKDKGYIIEGKEGGVVVAASSKSQVKTDELAASLKITVEEAVDFKSGKPDKVKQGTDTGKEEVKETKAIKAGSTQAKEEPAETKEDLEKSEENKDKEAKEEASAVKQAKETAKEDKKTDSDKEKVKGKRSGRNKFSIEVIEVSKDDVEGAKKHNVTPGKWSLIGRLKEIYPKDKTFKEEDWYEVPVQTIMKEIKNYSKDREKESKHEFKDDKKSEKELKQEFEQNKKDVKESDKKVESKDSNNKPFKDKDADNKSSKNKNNKND